MRQRIAHECGRVSGSVKFYVLQHLLPIYLLNSVKRVTFVVEIKHTPVRSIFIRNIHFGRQAEWGRVYARLTIIFFFVPSDCCIGLRLGIVVIPRG